MLSVANYRFLLNVVAPLCSVPFFVNRKTPCSSECKATFQVVGGFEVKTSNISSIPFSAKSGMVDASQEMVALGAANLFGSFFQSMPVSASFGRTAVNAASGVRTTLGGLVSSE